MIRSNSGSWLARIGIVWLIVASTFVFGAAAMSEAASAGEYEVRVCDFSARGGPNVDYSYFKYERGFYANNNCPLDLTIGNDWDWEPSAPTMLGDIGGFEGPASPTPLHQVEFEVSGGDTSGLVEYSFTRCMGCEPIATIEPGEGPDFVNRSIDLGGSNFTSIQAVCVALVCPRATPLRMRNFKFTAVDDVPPSISAPAVSYGSPWGKRQPLGWVSGSVSTIRAAAGDSGSGLEEAVFRVDGTTVEWFVCPDGSSDFIFTMFTLCDELAFFGESLDIGRLTDGPHTLEISARDLVGNVADTYTETFYVDNTPPAQPENPRVLNPLGFEGWSHDRVFTVEYDNPYMDPRNVHGAGIERLHFDLEPRTAATEDPAPFYATMAQQRVSVGLPSEGRWRLWFWVEDRAGAMSNRAHIDLGFDYEKPVAPKLEPSGWLSMEKLMRGHFQRWTPSEQSDQLESGICGYAFSVDDVVGSVPDVALDIPVGVDQASVSPTVGPGRHFAHLRAVACNGRASDTDTAQLNVDASPPTVTSFPASHPNWTADPTVVTISGADDLSGVARLEYSVGGGPIETVASSRAYVTMPEGEATVEYQAFDRAGNASAKGRTITKIDTAAPAVSFAPRSTFEPAVLTAQVTDGGSGVANAWLELSEAGSGNWRQFGPSVAPNTDRVTFSREILERLSLIGEFDFRVVAVDGAGNTTFGVHGAGLERLVLPLKAATAMTLGVASVEYRCVTASGRRCKSVRACPRSTTCSRERVVNTDGAASFRRIRFGQDLALVGSLLGRDGSPLGGQPVEIVSTPKFGVERTIAEVTTDQVGDFSFALPDAPSSIYVARFAGNSLHTAQRQTVEVSVRAKVTLKVSRTRVKENQVIRFSGRVLGAQQYAADGGKIVTLQFLRGRRWMNTFNSPRTDSSGRFSETVEWPSITRRSRVYFHAKVIPDGTWPFAIGSSEPVAVVLLP